MAETFGAVVSLTLDIEPEEFSEVEQQFIVDLARLLDVPPDDIEIIDVRPGCSKLRIRIPEVVRPLYEQIKLRDRVVDFGEAKEKEILNFVRKYRVTLELDLPPAAGRTRPSLPPISDRTVTWLHLSDAHFECADTGTRRSFWNQELIRDAFVEQIPALLYEEDLVPDFVFFTGDIAFSGSDREYELAFSFLEQLRAALPKGDQTQLLLVPGNHDVDRNIVRKYRREEEDARSQLTSNDAINEYLCSPECEADRERVFARLKNYFEFSQTCNQIGQPALNHEYFFTATFNASDVAVGVAGLNSAWRCSGDGDYASLILGVPQINTAIADLKNADLRILLSHHPPESGWFTRCDTIYQREKMKNFDFVLRGHEHDPHNEVSGFPAKHQYFRISAGALYPHRSEHESPKSFNAVLLDIETGLMWIFFWRLVETKYRWIKDLESVSQGFHIFAMPPCLIKRLRNASRVGRRSVTSP